MQADPGGRRQRRPRPIDGAASTFAAALAEAGNADAVIVMAGTISDGRGRPGDLHRTTARDTRSCEAGAGTSTGTWTARRPSRPSAAPNPHEEQQHRGDDQGRHGRGRRPWRTRRPWSSRTTPASRWIRLSSARTARPSSRRGSPARRTATSSPTCSSASRTRPGKSPFTYPYDGQGLPRPRHSAPVPRRPIVDGQQTVEYTEQLNIGYRWYDSNVSGECAPAEDGSNPCVAFPFGHGLSYTDFEISKVHGQPEGLRRQQAHQGEASSSRTPETWPVPRCPQVYVSPPGRGG